MRDIFMGAVIGLAALGALGAAQAQSVSEMDGWAVHGTEHDYPTLIERLNQAIEASPVNVVTRASATVGARNLGQTIPGNMVVGAYGPQFAVRMLEASVQAGIEAPIRFYLTENEDGTATLSYVTPSAVFAPYMDEGGAALQSLAEELDLIFAEIAAATSAAE